MPSIAIMANPPNACVPVAEIAARIAIRDTVALRAGGVSLRSVSTTLKAAGHDLSHAAWARVLRETAY